MILFAVHGYEYFLIPTRSNIIDYNLKILIYLLTHNPTVMERGDLM